MNGMDTLLAALPILVILVLMVGLRRSAALAGVVGAGVAVGVALAAFGFPRATLPGLGVADGLLGAFAEAGFTALTILWIIGPALGIHELQRRTGAAAVLRDALASVAPDPRILALLVAWFFVLFMEGAAGFGASVALAAPVLVAAGFPPLGAVTLALISHVVGVSFGAVGTPILPQMAVTGATGLELARAGGIYHTLLGWLPLGVMMVLAGRIADAGSGADPRAGTGNGVPTAATRRPPWRSTLGWTAAAWACFTLPYTLFWAFVGPELPTLGGALFGGVLFLLLVRKFSRRGAAGGRTHTQEPPPAAAVLRAAAPYLVLVVVILATRLIPPLRAALEAPTLAWELHGAFAGSMAWLYHPGSVLLMGFGVGALLQRAARDQVVAAIVTATRSLIPVAAALVAMLILARVMLHSGMTEVLALSAAGAAGGLWPLAAPFVGLLGTFVTGSATASNILFTALQQETALALDSSPVGMAGVQNFGAAVGNMICPHNVIAAGATVGLARQEGAILRRTLPVALLYASLGGALALWLVN